MFWNLAWRILFFNFIYPKTSGFFVNFIRKNNVRARQIIYTFYLVLGLTLLNIAFATWQYFMLKDFVNDPENIDIGKAELSDTLDIFSGIANLAVNVITIIFFIRWFRRSYWNLHQLGSSEPSHAEGWAAGGWFVPILSLFRPFQIMKEIWYGTQKVYPHRFPVIESSFIVGWWWAFYLIMSIGNNVVLRMSFQSQSLEGLMNIALASIVMELIAIPAIFLTIQVIRRVSEFESILWDEANNPTESVFAPESPMPIDGSVSP